MRFPAFRSLLHSLAHRRAMRAWGNAGREAKRSSLASLRHKTARARELRAALNSFLQVAENKLALPRIGSNAFFRPMEADWSWRPECFRGPLAISGRSSIENRTAIGQGLTIFHDCRCSELTFRQLRNTHEEDLAPYGLRLDVFRFDGSFLSLVLDFPPEAMRDLCKRHLIRMDAIIESEHPIEIFARLNLQHGPNSENLVREIPAGEGKISVEFDLAYMDFNEVRAEKIWLDLILEGAEMNQVTLRDLTFNRSLRADM